jgi:hypothetical protein
MAEFSELSAEQQAMLRRPFDRLEGEIGGHTLIAGIRETLDRFDEIEYQSLLRHMTTWAGVKPEPRAAPSTSPSADPSAGRSLGRLGMYSGRGSGQAQGEMGMAESRVETVSRESIPVAFDKTWLADEDDVERYLQALRKRLLKMIREGKSIQI